MKVNIAIKERFLYINSGDFPLSFIRIILSQDGSVLFFYPTEYHSVNHFKRIH
ncbi:conserved hypothetical protein [delta proteobacterium NaphS2]|nr:conserved hypothetical protein [delta proteobacterium NaphS2]